MDRLAIHRVCSTGGLHSLLRKEIEFKEALPFFLDDLSWRCRLWFRDHGRSFGFRKEELLIEFFFFLDQWGIFAISFGFLFWRGWWRVFDFNFNWWRLNWFSMIFGWLGLNCRSRRCNLSLHFNYGGWSNSREIKRCRRNCSCRSVFWSWNALHRLSSFWFLCCSRFLRLSRFLFRHWVLLRGGSFLLADRLHEVIKFLLEEALVFLIGAFRVDVDIEGVL